MPKAEPAARPVLRFTPYAWGKLVWFCHHGPTEIGGFGIAPGTPASPGSDLLLVEDFVTVRQTASVAHVAFEDEAVADLFEDQVALGRQPEQFMRIWCHTHPGESPHPSATDEETFQDVFGRCDWAVMFILARGGQTYARLRFNVGPGGHGRIPVRVDYTEPFTGSDVMRWSSEYEAHIRPQPLQPLAAETFAGLDELELDEPWASEGADAMDEPFERLAAFEAQMQTFEDAPHLGGGIAMEAELQDEVDESEVF